MKKIPVLATIRDAYNFTLANLGAIIGLIWLPMIIVTVMDFFVLQRFFEAAATALASGNRDMGAEGLAPIFFVVLSAVFLAMMSVSVTQLAQGGHQSGALVHFAFGAAEWRVLKALLSLIGLMFLFFVATSIAVGSVASIGAGLAGLPGAALLVSLFLVAFSVLAVRFGILLSAVAVAETGAVLPRAWRLSEGNFWRIFAVTAATIAPVWILSSLIQLLVQGQQVILPAVGSRAMLAAQFHMTAMQMPTAFGINFLFAPLLLGLTLGAGASVYRTLSGANSVDQTV